MIDCRTPTGNYSALENSPVKSGHSEKMGQSESLPIFPIPANGTPKPASLGGCRGTGRNIERTFSSASYFGGFDHTNNGN